MESTIIVQINTPLLKNEVDIMRKAELMIIDDEPINLYFFTD